MKKILLKFTFSIICFISFIFPFFLLGLVGTLFERASIYLLPLLLIIYLVFPIFLYLKFKDRSLTNEMIIKIEVFYDYIVKYKKVLTLTIMVLLIIFFSINLLLNLKEERMCMKVVSWEDDNFLNEDYKKTLYLDDDFYLNHCKTNDYDCSDFCSQEDAIKLFNECYDMGGVEKEPARDINNLDKDNDGIPCESLR